MRRASTATTRPAPGRKRDRPLPGRTPVAGSCEMLGGSAAAALAAATAERAAARRGRLAGPSSSRTSPAPPACSRARNVSGSPDDKQFLLEEMGGGAAFFDYDNDGWLDIFLVNGSSLDPAGPGPPAHAATSFTTTATARSPTSRRRPG